MAFTQSNLAGSNTKKRSKKCPRCGTLNYSTTKDVTFITFRYYMKFQCKKCGLEYDEWISDCQDA